MYCIRLDFEANAASLDEVQWFVAALLQNGQVLVGDWPMVKRENGVSIYVNAPTKDSPDAAGKYVDEARAALAKAQIEFTYSCLGVDPELAPLCQCVKRKWQILFTTYLDPSSPLRCGHCFGAIPLYKTPPMRGDYYFDAVSWQRDYRATDRLQMGGCGELFAEEAMSDIASELNRKGRELCAEFESLASIPTHYGFHVMREHKVCPSCNGDWHVYGEALHGLYSRGCDPCRLLLSQQPS